MNTVNCPGCSKTFGQGISIKAHQRTCSGLRLIGEQRIKKRRENAQKQMVAKHARVEGRTADKIAEDRQQLRDTGVLDDQAETSTVSMVTLYCLRVIQLCRVDT